MKRLTTLLTAMMPLVIISCAHSTGTDAVPHYNPGDDVRKDIQSFSNIGRLQVWMAGCNSSLLISSTNEFYDTIKYFGVIPKEDLLLLETQMNKAFALYHFGFECDNSVIVGFDQEEVQTFIYPSRFSSN